MEFFQNAKPVFLKDKSRSMNIQTAFFCRFYAEKNIEYTLKITGASLYRIYFNGLFLHYGPARAPHGYARVDSLVLPCKSGENIIAVELAGYCCGSFYTLKQPSFLQAEIFENGSSVRFTGRDFSLLDLSKLRQQKVLRYSYQRAFCEVYDYSKQSVDYTDVYGNDEYEEVQIDLKYLSRDFYLPEFPIFDEIKQNGYGKIKSLGRCINTDKRFLNINGEVEGFTIDECPDKLLDDLNFDYLPCRDNSVKNLNEKEYSLFEFSRISTGFIGINLKAKNDSVIYLSFAEKLTNGKIECGLNKDDMLNTVKITLPKGKEISFETFECYTLQFLAVICLKGNVSFDGVYMREYVYPCKKYKNPFKERPGLDSICTAAFHTFRQNTIDTFMDCPGRERGGYLCDGYFTAAASEIFTNSYDTEKYFLENFLYTSHFKDLPIGMLPMCYPGENIGKTAIPEWTLWFILQLEKFAQRGGDITPYKNLVCEILDYFCCFENEFGLLENLPFWNFVEWSKANDYTNGVNFPINMLYYKALKIGSQLFSITEITLKAENLRKNIIEKSFDGNYFHDHCVRKNGDLVLCTEKTQICQHEAFFFEVADDFDEKFQDLKKKVIAFGGMRESVDGLEPLGIFIGLNIRMELLNRFGEYSKNLDEIESLYKPMATLSGTLWEHIDADKGSLNHALNSSVAARINECAFALKKGEK